MKTNEEDVVEEFSIQYGNCAASWPAQQQLRWGVFKYDAKEKCWKYSGELDGVAHSMLLQRFGLISQISQFPLAEVVTMSPADLRDAAWLHAGDAKFKIMSDGLGPPRSFNEDTAGIR